MVEGVQQGPAPTTHKVRTREREGTKRSPALARWQKQTVRNTTNN